MHNRRVLVFQAVNYGASKASASANTAANPADLAVGACGVYGIHEAGATNLYKTVLITNGGAETAGFVPMATFSGREVYIAQGVALSAGGSAVRLSAPISLSPVTGIKKVAAKVYTAPVRGVLRIGYNGTAGSSYNLPSVINNGDDFIVSLYNRNYLPSGYQEPGQKVILSAQAVAGDTAYSLSSRFVLNINNRYAVAPVADNFLINPLLLKILSNGSGSAFTTSATAALTNGSTAVTTSAVHGVTLGQWIILNGDLYQAAVIPDTTHITLDRPWQQATVAALANASCINTGSTTVPTQIGLELVDNADFLNIESSVQADLQNSTMIRYTLPTPGSGSNAEAVYIEKEALGKKGSEDQIVRYMPLDTVYSQVAGASYDFYEFETQQVTQSYGGQGSVFKVLNYIICMFVTGQSATTGKNQNDFEDIMQTLFPTPAIPTIN